METYIEKMKIEIDPEKNVVIECDECNYEFEEKENIVSEENKKYCRLCYALNHKSEILGFSNSNLKASMIDSRKKFKSGEKSSTLQVPQTPTKFGKQSGHFDNYRMASTAKPEPGMLKPSTNSFRSECNICKKTDEPVIRTIKNGEVCFSCYYKHK